MGKLFMRREWKGTFAQLGIVAVLLPTIAVIIYIIHGSSPETFSWLIDGAVSYIPGYDYVKGVILGLDVKNISSFYEDYITTMTTYVQDNLESVIYLGLWMVAFRILFKEVIGIPGLPILQVMCGFGMGAMTYPMLGDLASKRLALIFLLLLNAVILLIFVPGRKKLHKLLWLISSVVIESLMAILTVTYGTVLTLGSMGAINGIGVFFTTILFILILIVGISFLDYLST